MKVWLLSGQSLGLEMTTVSAAGDPTPHADTHMWNGAGSFAGNAWVTPTGGGLISMLNAMRAVLNEPIYVVVACTGGTGLLQNDVGTPSGFWTDTAPGSLINNAIASVNAALATLPSGTTLDRIEFWGMQQDCFASGYADMFNACLDGLATLLSLFQAAFGTGFRLCIWPLASCHRGTRSR